MSIALHVKVKELEAKVIELDRKRMEQWGEEAAERLKELDRRITALENRPKPGRPPKNG